MTTVVLFDIDGTLLRAHGAGARSIAQALREVFGTSGPTDHRFDGKTDPQIVRELMTRAGIADETIDAGMSAVLARYLELLALELRDGAHVELLPGVPALLDAVGARAIGVETGRYTAADLLPYEPVAVFADLTDTEAVVRALRGDAVLAA